MVEHLPQATFGKPEGASAYQVIEKHAAFDAPEVADAFQKICTGFEWKPTTEEKTHPPCFAVLPLESVTVVARYTDAGRDRIGRPHTLRIHCILAPPEKFPAAWKAIAPEEPPITLPDKNTLIILGDKSTHTAQTK